MNERIKELLEHVGGYGAKALMHPDDVEKFAELLIRECAEQVKNLRVNDYGISGAEIIREHFGVTE